MLLHRRCPAEVMIGLTDRLHPGVGARVASGGMDGALVQSASPRCEGFVPSAMSETQGGPRRALLTRTPRRSPRSAQLNEAPQESRRWKTRPGSA